MAIRIALFDDVEEAIPIGHFFALHQIEFIGERPPDVAIGGEAGDDVAEVAIVGFTRHFRIAPAVVGMKQDEIGFDA